MSELRLYNTKTRSVELFKPLEAGRVGLYTCGPTVYHYVHLGNLRTYILNDVLKRVLKWQGYEVNHVMNITDVGHLVSDGDEGEDKLEKGAKRQGQTVWQVAEYYTKAFEWDIEQLGIEPATKVVPATSEIEAQQDLIAQLLEKGAAYQTEEAIYFDVSTFDDYWKLSGQKLEDKQVAVRDEVNEDSAKRHPADFALWFFTVGRFADHQMHWPSPWGEGFPGWHIECSAIAMKYVGQQIDIHTGGVDLMGTHHPNEIAQSEVATGKEFVNFWVHGEFLNISGDKMSKSSDNFFRLQTIIEAGFDPIAYRYFCLTAHYRSVLDFDLEKLGVAAVTLRNLKRAVGVWPTAVRVGVEDELSASFLQRFEAAILNDLDMPMAVSVVWEMVGSTLPETEKRQLMNRFDEVLGLGLVDYVQPDLTESEHALFEQRVEARNNKDWAKSDELRAELAKTGVEVQDGPGGSTWSKV